MRLKDERLFTSMRCCRSPVGFHIQSPYFIYTFIAYCLLNFIAFHPDSYFARLLLNRMYLIWFFFLASAIIITMVWMKMIRKIVSRMPKWKKRAANIKERAYADKEKNRREERKKKEEEKNVNANTNNQQWNSIRCWNSRVKRRTWINNLVRSLRQVKLIHRFCYHSNIIKSASSSAHTHTHALRMDEIEWYRQRYEN